MFTKRDIFNETITTPFRTMEDYKPKFKVLLTSSDIPIEALTGLITLCQIVLCKPAPTRGKILEKCRGVDAIIWACPELLDATILETAGPQLKVIACLSNCVRHVAVQELRNRNIKLSNTPIVASDSIANIVIFLMLATSRRYLECRQAIQNDEWHFGYQWMIGKDLCGSTVGIVGYEHLGKILVRKLSVFGVGRFVYFGQCVCESEECKERDVKCCTFEQLLRVSDFVIICCQPPPTNKGKKIVFDSQAFSMMKRTAILINVAKASVVDYSALAAALKSGRIYAAGLDVTAPEPLPPDHELLGLQNCVITPHIGSATERTRMAMAKLAVRNVILALNDLPMLTPV